MLALENSDPKLPFDKRGPSTNLTSMKNQIEVRRATTGDAPTISNIVIDTIRVSNSMDYPASVIERVSANFSAEVVCESMNSRTVWIALIDGVVVGTASLENDTVRTVFVAPSAQRAGVGRRLMQTIELAATNQRPTRLRVPASLTARSFYGCLGYKDVREILYGEERTFLMEKWLVEPSVE